MDVSTGEFRATELEITEVAGARSKQLGAREVWSPAELPLLIGPARAAVDLDGSRRLGVHPRLRRAHSARTFRLLSLDGCGLGRRWRWARPERSSTICATRSARRSTISSGRHITTAPNRMVLDAVTVRNLELVEPMFATERAQSAFHAARRPRSDLTGMGGRLMRQRLLRPSHRSGGNRSAAGRSGRTA